MASLRRISFALYILLTFANVPAQKRSERIVGGESVSIAEHPYMINLRKQGRNYCGGSLVTPDCVVTAAHCLEEQDYKKFSVHGGTTSIFEKGVSRTIEFYTVPSTYEFPRLNMDIAVLKLDQPLYGRDVQIIPLDFTEVFDYETISVSGWGLTQTIPKRVETSSLQTVNLTVIPWLSCAIKYAFFDGLTQNTFCAIDYGKTTCKGDSGGPIVRNGRQVGIVVGGLCDNSPGIFTKFSSSPVKHFLQSAINAFCKG